MKKLVTIAAAVVGMAAMQAQADVLTFDDQPGSYNIHTSLTSGGFICSSGHFHLFPVDRDAETTFAHNGTTYISYESGRGEPILLSRVDGAAFDLLSLDAAGFYANNNADRPNAEVLELVGYTVAGETVTTSFSLDGLVDGIGGAVDFQHFVLPATFSDLLGIQVIGRRLNGSDGGIAVDNLEYFLSASNSVPEPGSLALFGLGLTALAAVRRRRKA